MDKTRLKLIGFPALVIAVWLTMIIIMCVKGYQQEQGTKAQVESLHREVTAQKNLTDVQHSQFEQMIQQKEDQVTALQKQLEEAQAALKDAQTNFH